jgi:hypothetical protein
VDLLFAITERCKDAFNVDTLSPAVRWRETASELAGTV